MFRHSCWQGLLSWHSSTSAPRTTWRVNLSFRQQRTREGVQQKVLLTRKPTDTGSVSAGVAYRTALPGDARCSLRPGQDWSSQRGHQLRAEPRPDSGTIAKDGPPLQARAGASISEKHRTRGTQAPEAAGNVPALVGARVRGLLTFVNVWETERDQSFNTTAIQRWRTYEFLLGKKKW